METRRLILRPYKQEDLEDYWEYISNPNVVEYEPYKPMSLSEAKESLQERIANTEFIAVEEKDSHRMIGNVYLGKREFNTLEIGYVFNEHYWKKGYAKEACSALIEKAFEDGIHRIYAECDPDNPNSWRLLEKLGFVREAHLKENVYFWTDENDRPIWKDTLIYSLLGEKNASKK